jgi:hypothetical protein
MGGGFDKVYTPDRERAKKYDTLFRKYRKLGKFIENDLTEFNK